MASQAENLLVLKSTKAQLEVGLIYLKRRHTELQRQIDAIESQGKRGVHPDAFSQLKRTVQEHAIQIERRKLEIEEIDGKIQTLQNPMVAAGARGLSIEHDDVTAEIAQIREQVLTTLRQLAEPLHRYEQLVERKNHLARELGARTGRDLAYANYIEGALLRQGEYTGDIRYVVELLKRARVVA
jgi:chromosome segregation ATPase